MNDNVEKELDDILRESGLSYRENRISYILTCPKCEKREKLYIRKRDGKFICWHCSESIGFRGKAEFALVALLGGQHAEYRAKLYGEGAHAITGQFWEPEIKSFYDEDDEVDENVESQELATVKWPYDFYPIGDKLSATGQRYLGDVRGIPLSIAQAYNIRFCPKTQRVYFPIETNGKLYGWQGRATKEYWYWDPASGRYKTPPKALTSEDAPKGSTLMFGDRLNGSQHAIIFEGPVDAIKAHLCGGNVCTMGKAVTRKQISIIKSSGIGKIYIGLDPDAYEETKKLISTVDEVEFYSMMAPARYKDIGEMPFDEVRELFRSAERMNPAKIYAYIKRPY
jgi:hypothetical protein